MHRSASYMSSFEVARLPCLKQCSTAWFSEIRSSTSERALAGRGVV
jgi:hypothetical protein